MKGVNKFVKKKYKLEGVKNFVKTKMSDKESLLKKEKKKKEEKQKQKETCACAKCPHRPPQSFTPPPQKSQTIKKQTQKNYNKLLKIT